MKQLNRRYFALSPEDEKEVLRTTVTQDQNSALIF